MSIRERVQKIRDFVITIRHVFILARFDAQCQWRKHVTLRWYRLWLRKDEFHPSLDLDAMALCAMDEREKSEYRRDLTRRRHKAHVRDMRMDSA